METIQTTDMSITNQLEARNLVLSFPGKTLLNATSLTIESGMVTSLQGRNGTGKSTLLRCLAGLHAPTAGEVILNGTPISNMSVLERSRFIGALWTERVRIPGISVQDLVLMGTFNSGRSSETSSTKLVNECVEELGISDLATSPLDRLSDGELQKAMIARALAQQPSFLLLDEPTTYLDYVAKEELMKTLLHICNSRGVGILFTSHDLDIIRTYAHRKLELKDAAITQID
jgi:iron complex transport system ATP-binding protein